MTDLNTIIKMALALSPSDLHISVGVPPVCRVEGHLTELPLPPTTPEDNEQSLRALLSPELFAQLVCEGEVDVSLSPPDAPLIRMRLNAYRQRGSFCMAFRILDQHIPSFEELGLPLAVVEGFCRLNHGLVLVTGPTGTGKTTTITAMIDWINHNRACHIITIEDPIEYFHHHHRSIIHQRETGKDTKSFSTALRAALRQDPDVIFIGEMRDLDSISTALTAAETGHLVFSTLHTIGSAKTIDRIIDVFPPTQQQQIRVQLSLVLQGIVSQQLIATQQRKGRELATEVLLMTPAVRNLIRENHVAQISNAIITGTQLGMHTMDSSLAHLACAGRISPDEAKAYALAPEQIEGLMARMPRPDHKEL